MDKTRIMKALGVEALESDSNGGIYLVASLVDNLDGFLASLEHLEGTLEAKDKEIESLNGMIASMKTAHEEALAAKDAEIEAAKVKAQTETNDELKAEIDALKENVEKMENDAEAARKNLEDLQNQLAGKDEEISALKNDLENKKKLLAEKEAEINELSQAAQEAPSPQEAPRSNKTAETNKGFHVENVCKEGMSMAEKKAAWEKREKELKARRFG